MLFADDNNKQPIFLLFKKLLSSRQSSTFQTFEHVEPCCSRVVTSLVRFDRCSALVVKHEPGTTIEATTASGRSHPTTVRDENSWIQRKTKVSASLSLSRRWWTYSSSSLVGKPRMDWSMRHLRYARVSKTPSLNWRMPSVLNLKISFRCPNLTSKVSRSTVLSVTDRSLSWFRTSIGGFRRKTNERNHPQGGEISPRWDEEVFRRLWFMVTRISRQERSRTCWHTEEAWPKITRCLAWLRTFNIH